MTQEVIIKNDVETVQQIFTSCQEKSKKGNSNFILNYKNKKIKIFLGEDWSYLLGKIDKENNISIEGDYIYFIINIENDNLVFFNKEYSKDKLVNFEKTVREEKREKKICFSVYFEEKQYGQPFSKVWYILDYLHKISDNRVIYSMGSYKK